MKIKNIALRTLLACTMVAGLASCADWLNVDMEDQIMEDKLFAENDGYLTVLNGVYNKMNEQYSSSMTMAQLDVMANLYNVGKDHRFYYAHNHEFDESDFRSFSSSMWSNLYSMIANLNVLLAHVDEPNSSIKSHYYNYIKGEALALRAFMHFDLLRLYGPIYSSATENEVCIPYQETDSKEIQPLLTAGQVMEKIIRDLNEAEKLLSEDRIIKEGVLDDDSEDLNENTDFRYRQYRMNYFAVEALLARVYLWKGDKQQAYTYAMNIINKNKVNDDLTIFPWTTRSQAEGDLADRIFSSEVIFGLYNASRVNQYNSLYNPSAQFNNMLSFSGKSVEVGDEGSKLTYFYDDSNDVRRHMWSVENVTSQDEYGKQEENTVLAFSKFKDINATDNYRYMMPLIRLSEVYLIAAECCGSPEEAIEYINKIREPRNCVNLAVTDATTEAEILDYVDAEFYRETIGEGQIFYNYKRRSKTTILAGTITETEELDWDTWEYYTVYNYKAQMDLSNYVLPLPKDEADKRGV